MRTPQHIISAERVGYIWECSGLTELWHRRTATLFWDEQPHSQYMFQAIDYD